MHLFHIVRQEVLYCPVVQGHYKWGRESDEVPKRDRRGLERSTSFPRCGLNWGDYGAGRGTKKIPPQGHQDYTIAFQFSEVNTASLWTTALICFAVQPVHLSSVLNGPLDFSFRLNSDTVDYEDSCLIVRYLASMRPFAQSFDIYLSQVRGFHLNKCEWEILLCWLSLTFFSDCLSCIDSESSGWECHCSQN